MTTQKQNELRILFGQWLKSVRITRQTSATELAMKMDIRPATLEKLEAGKFNADMDLVFNYLDKLELEGAIPFPTEFTRRLTKTP